MFLKEKTRQQIFFLKLLPMHFGLAIHAHYSFYLRIFAQPWAQPFGCVNDTAAISPSRSLRFCLRCVATLRCIYMASGEQAAATQEQFLPEALRSAYIVGLAWRLSVFLCWSELPNPACYGETQIKGVET